MRHFAHIGGLMHESWGLKKELGAGGGGFMLILASPSNHDRIRERLRCLLEVSVEIGAT